MSELILIVEDDREIADLLAAYLDRAGFATDWAGTVPDAIRAHGRQLPALVLLDIGLPGGDGVDVLNAIRRRAETPVIMVTAVDDATTKLDSLRTGADDYIVKPFNPSEVVERVRAVLRRSQGAAGRSQLAVDTLTLDLDARVAQVRGVDGTPVPLALTPTEFAILAHMMRQPQRAFTRSELLDAAAPGSPAFDRVVDSHLSKLRAKLAAAGCATLITPVRGIGYRLSAAA